jgi:hypothetical protein
MTLKAPKLDERNADGVVAEVEQGLAVQGWQGQEHAAGWALVRLFGRLAELVINRLNQASDKHFLAFLNEAGIDLIPPRPAVAELTFSPMEDGPDAIQVPAGTQVATLQIEDRPEIVFETQDHLVVAQSELVGVITFDPRDYADRTEQARGQGADPFPVFEGQQERQRILYLGDRQLFSFPDDASRGSATVTVSFEFDVPGDPAIDGWRIEWLYWDGTDWQGLEEAGATVVDGTGNFSQNGDVRLRKLPEMVETDVGLLFSVETDFQEDLEAGVLSEGFRQAFEAHGIALSDDVTITVSEEGDQWQISDHAAGRTYTVKQGEALDIYLAGETSLWIAGRLTGGTERNHPPVLRSVKGSRSINITLSQTAVADPERLAAFSAIQANTAFTPLDLADEFFPLGQRPGQLDTFYLMSDEAFSKPGATVTLAITELETGLADLNIDELDEQRRQELDSLTIVWEYHSTDGWMTLGTSTRGNVTSDRLGFEDTTFAFTKAGDEQTAPYVEFTVPADGGDAPMFKKTAVNDQEGFWIRARIVAGSYNAPAFVEVRNRERGDYIFHEAKTYAPLIKELKVTYNGYQSIIDEKDVALCRSQVDRVVRDHAPDRAAGKAFGPFCAAYEGPALYLGVQPGFPAGQWIQMLLDLEQGPEIPDTRPAISWEYWNGRRWTALKVSDDSQGLSLRGYLGFFAPDDHPASNEFGQVAYWVRGRLPRSQPRAQAGHGQTVRIEDGEARITLDASGSQAFGCQTITRYLWRHVSLSADAGPDREVPLFEDEVTVTLDASKSQATEGRSVVKYRWRLVKLAEAEMSPPYLKAIRLNTVSALNTITNTEEMLGSSDGERDQVFELTRAPVLLDAQVAVLEPDQPPDEELEQLKKELKEVDEKAEALLDAPEGESIQGQWVRWHRVSGFDASTPRSRHFVLDPVNGRVRFGDGKRGKVPPIGRDNIKAVLYHVHDGAAGNVEADAITVLRNPSDELANIRSVTNLEAAAGGSDAETLEQVRERGPQSLKYRQRAVTVDDFKWVARETSGEVAQVHSIPTRNPKGLPEPGWVTVVIIPKSTAAKPVPNRALVRRVRDYLEDRALTNLTAGFSHVYVTGPAYVEATVRARVVPREPQKSDEIELRVLDRLEEFLHPLHGGPDRTGWELGRDVYLSEVHAEIEAVPGVDYAAHVDLLGSLQQQRLRLAKEQQGYRKAPFDIPTGSQVSTFDERIKLLLAEPVSRDEQLTGLAVSGFKVGDNVAIVAADNTVLKDDLKIASLSDDSITFHESFDPPADWDQPDNLMVPDALMSLDEHLRLPLAEDRDKFLLDETEGRKVRGVKVRNVRRGDRVSIVVRGRRDPSLELMPIERIEFRDDRIFVPEGHLIYSGSHEIEMVLE